MPVGAEVLRIRIQASSRRRRMLWLVGLLSIIVTLTSFSCRSWSLKCSATGEVLFLVRMAYLCSYVLCATVRPVSPTYWKLHRGHDRTYITLFVRQVLSPIILNFCLVSVEMMMFVLTILGHCLQRAFLQGLL